MPFLARDTWLAAGGTMKEVEQAVIPDSHGFDLTVLPTEDDIKECLDKAVLTPALTWGLFFVLSGLFCTFSLLHHDGQHSCFLTFHWDWGGGVALVWQLFLVEISLCPINSKTVFYSPARHAALAVGTVRHDTEVLIARAQALKVGMFWFQWSANIKGRQKGASSTTWTREKRTLVTFSSFSFWMLFHSLGCCCW